MGEEAGEEEFSRSVHQFIEVLLLATLRLVEELVKDMIEGY